MPCACKGYKLTVEIKTFVSNLKQMVLNDERTLKTPENGTRLCHVSAFHNDVKMLEILSIFFNFQRTALSVHVILLMQV